MLSQAIIDMYDLHNRIQNLFPGSWVPQFAILHNLMIYTDLHDLGVLYTTVATYNQLFMRENDFKSSPKFAYSCINLGYTSRVAAYIALGNLGFLGYKIP